MDGIDRKLDKFFADLYGDQADTERALLVRRELGNFIASALAPDSPGKRTHESAATRR